MVLGDLNIHHPSTDPLRELSSSEFSISSPCFELASDLCFELLNSPGVFTGLPFDLTTRPAVLDYSFANPSLLPFLSSWDATLPSTGFDHLPLLITLSTPRVKAPSPSPGLARTDWDTLKPLLQSFTIPPLPPLPTDLSVDAWTERHLSCPYTLLRLHTSMNRPSPRSKPWWSPLLSTLCFSFHRQQRVSRAAPSPSSLAKTRSLRNAYFKAIKKAKAARWKEFLSSINQLTVWTAARIFKGLDPHCFPSLPSATSTLQINDALLSHFFPPKPSAPSASFLRVAPATYPLQPKEISRSLCKSSNTSAPGPD